MAAFRKWYLSLMSLITLCFSFSSVPLLVWVYNKYKRSCDTIIYLLEVCRTYGGAERSTGHMGFTGCSANFPIVRRTFNQTFLPQNTGKKLKKWHKIGKIWVKSQRNLSEKHQIKIKLNLNIFYIQTRHEFKESRRERLFAPVEQKQKREHYFNTLIPCPTPLL